MNIRSRNMYRTQTALAVILILPAVAFASAPDQDFAGWYKSWTEQANARPYRAVHADYYNASDGTPLKLECENFLEPPHALRIAINPSVEKQFRFLINENYYATIESPMIEGARWSLVDFAFQSDSAFDNSAAARVSFGVSADFLGSYESLFGHAFRIEETDSANDNAARKLVFSFDLPKDSGPRILKQMVVFLDDTIGALPVEVTKMEAGGLTSRHVIDGWKQMDGFWGFERVTSYLRMAPEEAEARHSVTTWDFSPPAQHDKEECYLSYYGLPEPTEPRVTSRIAIMVALLIVFGVGYLMFRRRRA